VIFGLCNGHVEAGAKTIFESLHPVAFVFERMRFLETHLQSQNSNDGHGR
jgi:hypothetical protein